MALVYDLPEERLGSGYSAAATGNEAAEEMQRGGAAMMRTGQAVSAIMTDYQNDLDEAYTREADNYATREIQRLLEDPETGYLTLNGKAAVEARPRVREELQKVLDETGKIPQNDVQREMTNRVLTQRVQSALSRIDGHTVQQAKVYNMEESKARMDLARMGVASSYPGFRDPNSSYHTQLKILKDEAHTLARTMGLDESDAQTKSLILKAMTQAHADALYSMMAQRTPAQDMKDYLDGAIERGEFAPDKAAEFRDKLAKVNTATAADDLAERIYNEAVPDDLYGEVDILAAEKKIRLAAGDDEELQATAIAGFRDRLGSRDKQQNETTAARLNDVWGVVNEGGTLADVKTSQAYLALPEVKQQEIIRYIEREKREKEELELAWLSHDVQRLNLLESQRRHYGADVYLDTMDPTILSKMSRPEVEALRGRIGIEKTESLLRTWDQLQKPGKIGEAKMDQDDFYTVSIEMGMDPYSKAMRDRERVGALRFQVEQAIDLEQSARKAPMSRQEKLEFIRKQMANQVLVDRWFGSDVSRPAMALTPEEYGKVVVPDTARASILDMMSERYKKGGGARFEPTEANVKFWYVQDRLQRGITGYKSKF